MIGPIRNILHQGVHEFGPLIAREFDGRDGDDELGGGLGGTAILGGQGLEGEILDLDLDFGADLCGPSPLHLA